MCKVRAEHRRKMERKVKSSVTATEKKHQASFQATLTLVKYPNKHGEAKNDLNFSINNFCLVIHKLNILFETFSHSFYIS